MRALAVSLLGVALALPASATWIAGTQDEAWLGYAVAGAGDVDDDGFGDVLAGAPRHDGDGAVFLLRGAANGVLAPIRIDSDRAEAMLGSFVSSAGDVNGDAIADFAVGAESYEVTADAQGAVFVFHGAATPPANTDVASAASRVLLADAFAGLGAGDASAGDVNDDGFGDVVVGARFHGAGGGVFVLHGSATGIGVRESSAADARIEAEAADAELGASFASAGDVNDDGFDDVIAGAPEEDARGAVYLFHGGAAGVVASNTAQAATRLVAAEPGARFGFAVAGDCDVDGDGFDDVVVGAPRGGANGGGAVYVFRGGAQGVADGDTNGAALALESASADAQLGAAVACGDLDADGRAEVLAGAPRRDASNPASGAIAAFDFDSDTVVWQSGDRGFAAFGFAVAIRPRSASDAEAGWIAGAPFRSDADGEQGGVRIAAPESSAGLTALISAGALAALRARRSRARR